MKFLAGTLVELREEIGVAKKALTGMKQSIVSISSGCDLFVRFITLTSLDQTVTMCVCVRVRVCVCVRIHVCVCTCVCVCVCVCI